jgi:hypothetical protein
LAVTGKKHINPPLLTVEAILAPDGISDDATIIAKPAGAVWLPPFVTFRMGFHANGLRPEFQVLLEGDEAPTSIVAPAEVSFNCMCHLSGTYDGQVLRLYVDGEEASSQQKIGSIAASIEPTTIGARSSTSPGGFLFATVMELRLFSVPRTAEEIRTWLLKPLPPPGGPHCEGLYRSWPLDHGIAPGTGPPG